MARRLSPAIDAAAFVREGRRHDLRLVQVDADTFELAIVRRATGEAVGTVAATLDGEGRSLEVHHLWVAPALRGYGAGSEAAQLLLAACADNRIAIVRAWAHPGLGLSVYFWIRMGLHPGHGEGPNGGLSLSREIGTVTAAIR